MGDYGHDGYEWGFKDDSEKIEWEEYYESKSRKRGNEDGKDEELLRSELQANVDVEMEDGI